jgi:hypothetical protein
MREPRNWKILLSSWNSLSVILILDSFPTRIFMLSFFMFSISWKQETSLLVLHESLSLILRNFMYSCTFLTRHLYEYIVRIPKLIIVFRETRQRMLYPWCILRDIRKQEIPCQQITLQEDDYLDTVIIPLLFSLLSLPESGVTTSVPALRLQIASRFTTSRHPIISIEMVFKGSLNTSHVLECDKATDVKSSCSWFLGRLISRNTHESSLLLRNCYFQLRYWLVHCLVLEEMRTGNYILASKNPSQETAQEIRRKLTFLCVWCRSRPFVSISYSESLRCMSNLFLWLQDRGDEEQSLKHRFSASN